MADIKEWIKEQLEAGYSKEKIKQVLVQSGYDPNLVEEVLKERLIKRETKLNFMGALDKFLAILVIVLFAITIFFANQVSELDKDVDNLKKKTNRLVNKTESHDDSLGRLSNRTKNLGTRIDTLNTTVSDLQKLVK